MPGYELIGEEEKQALLELFNKSGGVFFAHGFDARRNGIFKVREFEKAFATKVNAQHGQALSSGTAALMTAMRCFNIGPGDEVITQSFTFVATVESILAAGATPVLTEVDYTFNMDPVDLEKKITPKTKAIIVVHMAGNPARMTEIKRIAAKHSLPVIEDTAQAIGAKYNNQYLGTLGEIGTYSLDFGKTITTGEGGMLVTNSESLFRIAREYHDHGHEYNPSLGRAQDTRTTWGLNFRMSELNAAVGLAQLKKLDFIVEKSRKHSAIIKESLSKIPSIRWREVPANSHENGDALYFYYDSESECQMALKRLSENGLTTKNVPDALRWHFAGEWEHMFKEGQHKGQNLESWPFTKNLLARSIALPILVGWNEENLKSHIANLDRALRF